MRARIVGLIVLTGFVAFQTSFTSGAGVADQAEVARPLTQTEMDCTVGGKANCAEVAAVSTAYCLWEYGIDFTDSQAMANNSGLVVLCAIEGTWAGLVCAWEWFTGLF